MIIFLKVLSHLLCAMSTHLNLRSPYLCSTFYSLSCKFVAISKIPLPVSIKLLQTILQVYIYSPDVF
jgi:hypothetical protein